VSRTHVLVAGVSTRAAAESAARAGFLVTAIDAFADLDQHPKVRAMALPSTFTARAAADAVRAVDCDAVAYLSPFENHPEAIDALSAQRTLWGNPAEMLRRARDPLIIAEALRARGFAVPEVRLKADTTTAAVASGRPGTDVASGFSRTDWLLKLLASGGGHRIRVWRRGDGVPRGSYLQEFIEGVAGSVVFVAANGRAVPIGVLRQLIGDGAFGASEFRYCGNILASGPDDEAIVEAACGLARAIVESFALVGVNGIDFVARDGVPYAVEVNPRWCASMELVERAYGISVFGMHAAACDAGTLPAFDVSHARRAARGAFGKAIVFAREDIVTGDTHRWLPADVRAPIRDIPPPRSRIRAGRPVCTVFAEASDAAACYSALVQRANRVYEELRTFG
jgi:predicted ATP-grasp superfamily ATP-dependent carboligase